MRILVVDDEQEIRDYISGMKEWGDIGCEIVGTASNGVKALEAIEALKPELVITDIRMPEMDGIALAEKVRRSHPDLPLIFLTAYNEFEYAHKGIKLGIADFLTKPFRSADLLQSVEVMLKDRKEKPQWVAREDAFAVLASAALSPADKQAWLGEHGLAEQACVLLYAEIDHIVSSFPERTPFSKLFMKSGISSAIGRGSLKAWAAETEGGLYLLLFAREGASEMGQASLELARAIIDGCEQESFTMSVAISRELPTPIELETALAQVAKCLEYRMLLGRKSVISYEALESMLADRKKEAEFSVIRLADMLRLADMDGIKELLRDVYRQMLSAGSGKREMQHGCLSLIDKAEQVMGEFGIALSASTTVDIRERLLSCVLLTDLMSCTEKQLELYAAKIGEAMGQSSNRLIVETKKIIETEYQGDLSLQALAKRLNVNYSHLSRLIKKETGKNFSDLLWEYRVDAAKSKLATGDLKAYEVAFAVGFKDSAHFNILFKKMTGLTPSAYRGQTSGRAKTE